MAALQKPDYSAGKWEKQQGSQANPVLRMVVYSLYSTPAKGNYLHIMGIIFIEGITFNTHC
jgi:hypothetical protein